MTDIKRGSIFVLFTIATIFILSAGCNTSDDDGTQPLIDTTPPAIPVGIAGIVDARGTISLSWAANTTDSDLSGYIVYRSNDQNTGYTPLISTPITSNSYEDISAGSSDVYYYSVSARDASHNESARSASYRIAMNDGEGRQISTR